jgi:peptidoglycan/LPS O-acetylase OafA/YrhL
MRGRVALSVLLPILRKSLPRFAEGTLVEDTTASRLRRIARPYVVVGAFSLAVALLVLAITAPQGTNIEHWWQALLTGYVSDSTLQKFTTS